jgi:Fur family transcriptional regulator, iron response regulator
MRGKGQCTAIDLEFPTEYMLWSGAHRRRMRPSGGELVLDRMQKVKEAKTNATARVREAGLRPTRQRVALAGLLFAKGNRHLSAEELHEEAIAAGVPVSLATVYNTLHQFTEAGMLRILAIEGSKTYFDTNTSDHHHFYIEGDNTLLDIAEGPVTVHNLPEPPEGLEIVNVDIVIRLRAKRRRS